MGQHDSSLSDEEWLMIYGLFLSISLIVLSQHTRLAPPFGSPVVRVALHDPSGAHGTGSVGTSASRPSGNAGLAMLPANQGAAAASGVPVPRLMQADGDFVPLSNEDYDALDMQFARAQLADADAGKGAATTAAFRIQKDFYVAGRRAGSLGVTVSRGGTLSLDGRELKMLLAQPKFRNGAISLPDLGDGPLTFGSLRAAGVNLRYSPEDDSFRLAG